MARKDRRKMDHTGPAEIWLDQGPEESMSTELGENISRVNLARNMEEPATPQDMVQGNGFTNECVIGQCIMMAFVQRRLCDIWADDDTCIITEHIGFTDDWGTDAVEHIRHIHYIFSSQSSNQKFRALLKYVAVSTISCSLQNQLAWVELKEWRISVIAWPIVRSCKRLASSIRCPNWLLASWRRHIKRWNPHINSIQFNSTQRLHSYTTCHEGF